MQITQQATKLQIEIAHLGHGAIDPSFEFQLEISTKRNIFEIFVSSVKFLTLRYNFLAVTSKSLPGFVKTTPGMAGRTEWGVNYLGRAGALG